MRQLTRCLWMLALLLGGQFALAGSPRDALLRLVPEDTGICVVVQDVRGQFDRLQGSPFFAQLRSSPLSTGVTQSKEAAKLIELRQFLDRLLGFDWVALRDDVFGDAIVLSVRPQAQGRPAEELFLLHARSPRLLNDLLDRLNLIQKQLGELKEVEPRTHAGQTYHRRLEVRQQNFTWLNGPVLALSSQEDAIRAVIDRSQAADTGEKPLAARQLALAGADSALAAAWLNPRSFDASMETHLAKAPAIEAKVRTNLLRCWKALDNVVLAVTCQRDVEIQLALAGRLAALPEGIRNLLVESARPSALWEHIPNDAILGMAGRAHLPALLDALGDLTTDADHRSLTALLDRSVGAVLGKDVRTDILPHIGPDWGISLLPPERGKREWFPRVLAAVRAVPGAGLPGVDRSLFQAVNSLAALAVLDHNRKHADSLRLLTTMDDAIEVKYLSNEDRFPPGLRPAFALKGGYLLLGSSPEAIRQFPVRVTAQQPVPEETPLLRLSIRALREYLREHRLAVGRAVAEKNALSEEIALRGLDAMLAGAELVDRIDLGQRCLGDQATLTLRVRFSHSLAR